MGLGRQDFSGKRVAPQEADAVIADLKKYLAEISDRWLIKGRFHSDMATGSLPMDWVNFTARCKTSGEVWRAATISTSCMR